MLAGLLTCTGGVSYPEGDPLGADRRMLISANRQNGDWFTMTPAQGAVPFEPGTPPSVQSVARLSPS